MSASSEASSVAPAAEHPRPSLGLLLGLAWPVVLARATQSVIGFCDALMTAPLGEQSLAAATMGSINTFSLVILPMGLVFIVQSFAAQLKGRGDLTAARRYAWYGLMLAGAAMVLALAATPLIGPALSWFDYEPAVRGQMADYMAVRLLSVGAIVGTEVLGNWYGGLGNTRLQLVAGVVAMVANVALNWVFIFGHLGAPALGVTGAAVASALASWLGFATIAWAFARGRGGAPRPGGPLGLRASELWRVLRFGFPNGVNWFLEFAAFAVFLNVVMAHLGTATLAAMNVVLAINSVSFMPAFGVASAGAILVGQAVGAGRRDHVWPTVRLTASVTISWMVGVGLIYLVIPDLLMSWFSRPGVDGDALRAAGGTMLAMSAAWQFFDALSMTVSETLRAVGDTAWCMWARILLAWAVFLPLAYVWIMHLGGGAVAAMLSLVGYLALLAAALAWRFRSGAWKRIEIIEPSVV